MNVMKEDMIYASCPFDSEAEQSIKEILMDYDPNIGTYAINETENGCKEAGTIEIQNRFGAYLASELNELVDAMAKFGIQLEGRVKYYGDTEGYHLLTPGEHVRDISTEQAVICFADDNSLISELQNRGYTIVENPRSEDAQVVVATSFGKLIARMGEEPDTFPEIIILLERENGMKQRIAVIGDLSMDEPDEDVIRVGVYGDPCGEELTDRVLIERRRIFSEDALWEK